MSDPIAYCREKAFARGSSLYYSFLLLDRPRHEAITALYAFFREIDGIADECSDAAIAHAKFSWWRSEIAHLYAGNPHHPVTQGLRHAISTYRLDEEHFLEIIDGMEADLEVNRYPDFKSLQLHCYRVSSVLCSLSSSIFGYSDRKTLKYAHDLGLALQMTYMIRDVGSDARKGRIYLPLDELAAHQVSESEILHGLESENVRRLIEFQINRARDYYTRAFSELPDVDRRAQRPGLILAAIHQALLNEIHAGNCEKVLNQRTALTPLRMLWLAWKTWVTG